jgi:hypothetical protein
MELEKKLQRAEEKLGPSYKEGLQSWKYQVAMEFLTAEDRELLRKSIAAWKKDATTPISEELLRVRRLFNLGYDYFATRKFVEMPYEDQQDLLREVRQKLRALREKGIE